MKKEQLIMTIPNPCSENWEAMTITDRGRFCASCQKTVIDLTNLTDEQIVDIIHASVAGHLCGRVASSQLNREIVKVSGRTSFGIILLQRVAASLLFLQTIVTSAIAQTVKPKTHQQPKEHYKYKAPAPMPRTISGIVKDEATGEVLCDVIVSVAGTAIKATTGNTGDFILQLPEQFGDRTVTLQVTDQPTGGTIILDEQVSLDSLLSARDVVLYRYPSEKEQQQVIAYRRPIIETMVAGGIMTSEVTQFPQRRWTLRGIFKRKNRAK